MDIYIYKNKLYVCVCVSVEWRHVFVSTDVMFSTDEITDRDTNDDRDTGT